MVRGEQHEVFRYAFQPVGFNTGRRHPGGAAGNSVRPVCGRGRTRRPGVRAGHGRRDGDQDAPGGKEGAHVDDGRFFGRHAEDGRVQCARRLKDRTRLERPGSGHDGQHGLHPRHGHGVHADPGRWPAHGRRGFGQYDERL